MNMNARNQYLKKLQLRYRKANKKEKSEILDEYCRNTGQNRKYVTSKINSSISSKSKTKQRKKYYGAQIKDPLVTIWNIFDRICSQRLAPMLTREMIARLRKDKEIIVSEEIALKLTEISPATIDRKLKHQREVDGLKRSYKVKRNSLLYQKIPVKFRDFDRDTPGFEQIDHVEHCGSSQRDDYANSVCVCDIALGWWEAEAVLGKAQY